MLIRILLTLSLLALLLVSIACSRQGPPASAPVAQPAQAPKGPGAEQHYAMYEQMLQADNAELAVPLGDEILKMYPDSEQAARVRVNIEELRKKASSEVEARRLARMWAYQTGPMSGGQQSTASIYSQDIPGAAGERVRLVFRRHTEWGQSVFVYGNEPGYTCAKECRVAVRFDDEPVKRYLGSIPPTGEPAIFIEEDKAFIARFEKAKKVEIEVSGKSAGAQTLKFEVGGYEPTKFLALGKAGK